MLAWKKFLCLFVILVFLAPEESIGQDASESSSDDSVTKPKKKKKKRRRRRRSQAERVDVDRIKDSLNKMIHVLMFTNSNLSSSLQYCERNPLHQETSFLDFHGASLTKTLQQWPRPLRAVAIFPLRHQSLYLHLAIH